MNEKDFNLAILNKLYEIAHKVFAEGVKIADGSYYATDLAKKGSEIFKDGYLKTEYKQTLEYDPNKYDKKQKIEKDCFVAPMATVSVLSFVCSFCVVKIFDLVARFEKLAGIPTKDRQIFVAASNIGNVLCTFEVEIQRPWNTIQICGYEGRYKTFDEKCMLGYKKSPSRGKQWSRIANKTICGVRWQCLG